MKHAVVTDNMIVTISSQARKLHKETIPTPHHISDLWQLGKDRGITHFWIMPDTQIASLEWAFVKNLDGWKIFIPGEKIEDDPPHTAACKKGYVKGTFEICVNYPASGYGFAWLANCPLDVLATIDYLAQVLGTQDIKYSAKHLGKQYLKTLYSATKRLASYIAKPETDLKKLPFNLAGPEIFYGNLLTQEMIGMWFHHIDKNSAHPSAASSMMTGTGEPLHLTTQPIEVKRPGVYRVSFTVGASPFNGVTLPLIIESEWVTLDVLKYAIQQGYAVQVQEAWIFEHAYRVFDEWARDLFKARQSLKDAQRFIYEPARENAYRTMKNVLNTSISAMKDNVNWWADMVGMARVARLANLKKWADESGVYPLYVFCDDMGFVSPAPTPEEAIPGIFERRLKTGEVIDNRQELGGYKLKYSMQITQEMVNECSSFSTLPSRQIAGRTHEYLKKQAKAKGLR